MFSDCGGRRALLFDTCSSKTRGAAVFPERDKRQDESVQESIQDPEMHQYSRIELLVRHRRTAAIIATTITPTTAITTTTSTGSSSSSSSGSGSGSNNTCKQQQHHRHTVSPDRVSSQLSRCGHVERNPVAVHTPVLVANA